MRKETMKAKKGQLSERELTMMTKPTTKKGQLSERGLTAKTGLTMERRLRAKKGLTTKRGLKVWKVCLKTTFGMPGCSLS